MAQQGKLIHFNDFAANLSAIFDEVAAQGQAVQVEHDGKVFTLKARTKRSMRKSYHFSMEDPLWDIVGIGHSEGPTDVSQNKHKYLADAITSRWEAPKTTQLSMNEDQMTASEQAPLSTAPDRTAEAS